MYCVAAYSQSLAVTGVDKSRPIALQLVPSFLVSLRVWYFNCILHSIQSNGTKVGYVQLEIRLSEMRQFRDIPQSKFNERP
jgi:hypothetical protein